jgi:hypothetical protein
MVIDGVSENDTPMFDFGVFSPSEAHVAIASFIEQDL